MWDTIRLVLVLGVLCLLALLGDQMENIIQQNPSFLEFEKPIAVFLEGDQKSAIIRSESMEYREKSGLATFFEVRGEVFDTDPKSKRFNQTTRIRSKIAEHRGNQTIFREDVHIVTDQGENLFTSLLHYYATPFKRMFCPAPVRVLKGGVEISGDQMDTVNSPFLKKVQLDGHVHLEIQGEFK